MWSSCMQPSGWRALNTPKANCPGTPDHLEGSGVSDGMCASMQSAYRSVRARQSITRAVQNRLAFGTFVANSGAWRASRGWLLGACLVCSVHASSSPSWPRVSPTWSLRPRLTWPVTTASKQCHIGAIPQQVTPSFITGVGASSSAIVVINISTNWWHLCNQGAKRQ